LSNGATIKGDNQCKDWPAVNGPDETTIENAKKCPCNCNRCKQHQFEVQRPDGLSEYWQIYIDEATPEGTNYLIRGRAGITVPYVDESENPIDLKKDRTYGSIAASYKVELLYDPKTKTGKVNYRKA